MKGYIKDKWKLIVLVSILYGIFFLTFYLYHLPLEAVWYPVLLSLVLLLGFGVVNFLQVQHRRKKYKVINPLPEDQLEDWLREGHILDWEYEKEIIALSNTIYQMRNEYYKELRETEEYYRTWVHQIKTPIAAMRLHLQNEDTDFARELLRDLFRIEQYVEMVLAYQRLESPSTDYVFRPIDLDELLRTCIKKFSGEFIARRLSIHYSPIHYTVITDEKWFSFVIEQILSNALKYTKEGSIAIYLEKEDVLCIEDTGMGIAPEDLPRIFENGYTGYNGRLDKKASGLGLYLSHRIMKKLGFTLTVESRLDEGTKVMLHIKQKEIKVE